MSRKVFAITLLLALFSGLAAYEVGDTLSLRLINFRLMLERDATPRSAIIRAKGQDSYIVTIMSDRAFVSSFLNVNDTLFASTITPEGYTPLYLYSRVPGGRWMKNTGPSGSDPDNTMSIYAMALSTDLFFNKKLMYIATSKGVLRTGTSWNSFYQIFGDTVNPWPCYDIWGNEFTNDSLLGGKVLYVGTQWGVYRLTSRGPGYNTPADTVRIGDLSGPVYAIATPPGDTSVILAGTDRGLFEWDGTSWSHVEEISGTVTRIKFIGTTAFICTDNGLYHGEDASSITKTLDGNQVTDVIYVNDNYYATVLGGGVQVSPDLEEWTPLNNGITVFSSFGSLNGRAIVTLSDGTLYYGCDIGTFKLSPGDTLWMYSPDGMGTLVGDEQVTALFNSYENPDPEDSLTILGKILATYDIPRDSLYDCDGDPRILIVISPLIVSTNITDLGATPVYGYFDPVDEDTVGGGNKHEMFVINPKEFADFTSDLIKSYMAYLTARYVAWSLDTKEDQTILTGLAMILAYKAGFDVQNGFTSGNQYATQPQCQFLNIPLYSYTVAWAYSPIAREHDRERMFLWFEYLRERFGDDFIKDVLFSRWNGIARIEKDIEDAGSTFLDVWQDWAIANILDDPDLAEGQYGYTDIDFTIDPSIFVPVPQEAGTDKTIDAYSYLVYKYEPLSDTTNNNFFVFNGLDSHIIVDGADTLSGFALYMIDIDTVDGNTTITSLTPDNLNRVKAEKNEPSTVLILNKKNTYSIYVTSKDVEPPMLTGFYTLQNPLLNTCADVYITAGEKIFYDVNIDYPYLEVIPSDNVYSAEEVAFEFFTQGSEFYMYHANTVIDMKGDVYLRVKGQDKSGNDLVLTEDTITVEYLLPDGGEIVALNGRIKLDVPRNSVYQPTKLIFDVARSAAVAEDNLTPIFVIGHENISLTKPVLLTITDESIRTLPENVTLYRYDGSNWVPLPCNINRDEGTIKASVATLGLFTVMSGTHAELPRTFAFQGLSVNPIGSFGKVFFQVPRMARVKIDLYDASGRLIRNIFDDEVAPGYNSIDFNAQNLRNGVYFLRMTADEFEAHHKIVVLH